MACFRLLHDDDDDDDLSLLFKVHEIWSVDSQENY